MLQNLMNNRKTSGLVLAGLAAFAYYKYSTMTPEEKSKLSKTLMEKGKSLLGQIMPGGANNLFGNSAGNKTNPAPGM